MLCPLGYLRLPLSVFVVFYLEYLIVLCFFRFQRANCFGLVISTCQVIG